MVVVVERQKWKIGWCGVLPCETGHRVHTLAGSSKVWVRRLSGRVHARIDIAVEVLGCYVGENEQTAAN